MGIQGNLGRWFAKTEVCLSKHCGNSEWERSLAAYFTWLLQCYHPGLPSYDNTACSLLHIYFWLWTHSICRQQDPTVKAYSTVQAMLWVCHSFKEYKFSVFFFFLFSALPMTFLLLAFTFGVSNFFPQTFLQSWLFWRSSNIWDLEAKRKICTINKF